jgi:hypothetical protein
MQNHNILNVTQMQNHNILNVKQMQNHNNLNVTRMQNHNMVVMVADEIMIDVKQALMNF